MKKALAVGLVIGLLAVASVGYLVLFPRGFALPEVKSMWHEWGALSKGTTEVVSHVIVHNPSNIPVVISDVSYTIYLNGIALAQGHSTGQVRLPPSGDAEITLRTHINNTRLPAWWVSHLSKGELTILEVKGSARGAVYGIQFSFPIYYTRELKTDLSEQLDYDDEITIYIAPSIRVVVRSVDTELGSFNDTTTQFVHTAKIYNPNDVMIIVGKMYAEAFVNDILIATGEQPLDAIIIGPHQEVSITFYSYLDNTKIDDVWATHLMNGERSRVFLRVYLVSGGELILIYEYEDEYETDILGSLSGSGP